MSQAATQEAPTQEAPMMNQTATPEAPAAGAPRLKDRDIFSWNCRGVLKHNDPMVVQRLMAECATAREFRPEAAVADLEVATADLTQASDGDKQGDTMAAFRAHANLAAMTRAGFGLKSVEEDIDEGWTEKELIALLGKFWRWCEELKKNSDGSPS